MPDADDTCQCPTCGRLHRDLKAGRPPASIRLSSSDLREAIHHLLWLWHQYGGAVAYGIPPNREMHFRHSCMAAGEDASEFLEGLGLGVDEGDTFVLNEDGCAIMEKLP